MRQLFLFGGGFSHFERLSESFVKAAGGTSARIGLLFSDREHIGSYFNRYASAWSKLGATVVAISPDPDGKLPPSELRVLCECTGVFMGGGNTRRYHEVYANGDTRAAIIDLYRSGRPYGGLSAGALVVPSTCLVWGDLISSKAGVFFVGGSESGCAVPVILDVGLGLIDEMIIETHFTSRSGFPRLSSALERSGIPFGLGIDDDICVSVTDERLISVEGLGRCYLFRRDMQRGSIEVRLVDPSGDSTDLKNVWGL